MDIHGLLRLMVERGASDLHLKVPSPPVLRVDGKLAPLQDLLQVTPEYVQECLEQITTQGQRDALHQDWGLDFSHSIAGLARFRASAFFQRGTISISVRQLPFTVPTIAELGLPDVCGVLALRPRGLILVAGPTGSGKSTTLAAMIDHVNSNVSKHIITIEDPIEYVHRDKRCLIAQRDLGDDAKSFASALRSSLRQDPDVVLVGEMRDLDTISAAITAAETGHLVFSTVHTNDAPQTIDRLVGVFPGNEQQQIRFQLSQVLEGVLSQLLVPRKGGRGRVPALEVMVCTDAIRNMIREGKTDQIPTFLQTGKQFGMQTMDQALEDLASNGIVDLGYATTGRIKPGDPEGQPIAVQGIPLARMN